MRHLIFISENGDNLVSKEVADAAAIAAIDFFGSDCVFVVVRIISLSYLSCHYNSNMYKKQYDYIEADCVLKHIQRDS